MNCGDNEGQRTGKNTTSIGPYRIAEKHFSWRKRVGFYASRRDRKVTQNWDFRARFVCAGVWARPGKERGKITALCARSRWFSKPSQGLTVQVSRGRMIVPVTHACEFTTKAGRGRQIVAIGPRPGEPRKKADPQGARLLSRHCHANSSIGEPIP